MWTPEVVRGVATASMACVVNDGYLTRAAKMKNKGDQQMAQDEAETEVVWATQA